MEAKIPEELEEKQNAQKQQETYRKSPWRFAFLLLALAAGYELAGNFLAVLLYLGMRDPVRTASEAATIGIIGGADGPTAIFVTYSVPSFVRVLVCILLMALGIFGYLRLKRCKRKD